MNLKEFDAKQFLLEKGERVGLGIAVGLMVLMLIVSLFLPSNGFFSGNPKDKAEPLARDTRSLQARLVDPNNKPTRPQDIAPNAEERKIDLDTSQLDPFFYATGNWFEPTTPENPARRPPLILTLDEAVGEVAYVLVDTYIFKGKDFSDVMVLRDPDKNTQAGGGAPGGGRNRVVGMYKGASMPGAGGQGGAGANASVQKIIRRIGGAGKGYPIQGFDDKPEFKTAWVPFANVSGADMLARQPQPTRMAIIAGSFPFKRQLEEFKNKLHLTNIQDVFDETVKIDDKEVEAFRFLSVYVQRREVDVADKPISQWTDLPLAQSYRIFLLNSGLPFEEDDPKYDPIKQLALALPRLREFHQQRPQNQMGMGGPGMRPPGAAFGPGGRGRAAEAAPVKEESHYPDVADKVKNVQDTLAKLAAVDAAKVVTITRSQAAANFNPFNPDVPLDTGKDNAKKNRSNKSKGQSEEGDYIPEHCLVRLVDVTIEAGKRYQYRFKVRMTNPNHGRDDVAAANYKIDTTLESREWFEKLPTIVVPPETIYYVVDEKKLNPNGVKTLKGDKLNPLYDMWRTDPSPRDRYVCMQLHRWLESTPIGGTDTPIGDWAIADRVFVARGEFAGKNVIVDLPVWKYTQDSFILPAENQKRKRGGRVPSGVNVNFGSDSSESGTILLDFEGGRQSLSEPSLRDDCGIEVLMLAPDGKLLARNSNKDAKDKERIDRRERAIKRIIDVRLGKTPGTGPASGGLDR